MTKSIVAAGDEPVVQPFSLRSITRTIADESVCITHCGEGIPADSQRIVCGRLCANGEEIGTISSPPERVKQVTSWADGTWQDVSLHHGREHSPGGESTQFTNRLFHGRETWLSRSEARQMVLGAFSVERHI